MITKIEITDNTNTPIKYLHDLDAFKNGMVYEFKTGVNIIIGPNGCGKSTLLDLISKFTLCQDTIVSQFPEFILELGDLFEDEKLKDGVKIHHDYLGCVFRYLPKAELRRLGKGSALKSMESMSTMITKSSTGESMMEGLDILFGKMFSGEAHVFPFMDVKRKMKTANEIWYPRLKSLFQYYKDNHIEVSSGDNDEYTVLLDEPDRNLDIDNIKSVSDILSFHKPQTQILAVIHNPSVIYKLWKQGEANIIEMTPGYLKKVIDYHEKF